VAETCQRSDKPPTPTVFTSVRVGHLGEGEEMTHGEEDCKKEDREEEDHEEEGPLSSSRVTTQGAFSLSGACRRGRWAD
jgi:hypothetical protein